MKKNILLFFIVTIGLFLTEKIFSADNVVNPNDGNHAYIQDVANNLLPLNVAYTTDGNGHLKVLVPGVSTIDDDIIVPPNSGKMYLNAADGKLYPAFVLYTTDGHGNVQPLVGGGGGGILSLNGLVGAAQSFSTGTTGSDFGIVSSGVSHTFNIPSASATKRGALTSSDWTIFNNKQNALGYTPLNVAGDSMFGNLDMLTNKILHLPSPIASDEPATKGYVDGLELGLLWQPKVDDSSLADDSLSSPPIGFTDSTLFILGANGTGAWSSFLAGHAIQHLNGAWVDLLGRVVQTGDRFCVTCDDGLGFEGGSLTGKHNKIATVSGGTPGAYTYTFTDPVTNYAFFINPNPNTDESEFSYTYSGSLAQWIQFSGLQAVTTGNALAYTGVTLNALFDGTSVSINGSNQLQVINREPTITASTTATYYRGDKSFQILDTSVVPENGALYFTPSRAQAAVSATAPIVDTAGVFSIPAATNLVNGYLTSSDWTIFNNKQPSGSYITALTSDVSASGPGSASATVNSIGGSSAANVHAAELLANAATTSNTASTIIKRDGSGNFIAGTMTGNIVGQASGGALTVTGGTAASGGNGGQVTVAGASGSGTGSGGTGGNLNLNGGVANGDNTVNQTGGSVSISGGQSKGSATGGTVTVSSGTGGTGTGTAGATGGTTNINGGTGGAGSATSGNGGGFTGKAGSGGGGVAGGAGGTAQIVGGTGGTGSSTGGNGGPANVTGGSPGGNAGAQGGSVTISGSGGSNTGAGGAGGPVTISTGAAGGDNTSNVAGGSLTMTVGSSKGSSGGSNITMTAGTGGIGTSTTGANGGTTTINAGTGGAGSATGGTGGNLILQAGAGGNSGTPGAGGIIQFFTGPANTLAEHLRVTNAGDTYTSNGNLQVNTAGYGLGIKGGTNAKIGTAILVGGTVTVSTSAVTANSRIFLTSQSDGGTPGFVRVTAKTAGTSFVITSSNGADTSTIAWFIVEQL